MSKIISKLLGICVIPFLLVSSHAQAVLPVLSQFGVASPNVPLPGAVAADTQTIISTTFDRFGPFPQGPLPAAWSQVDPAGIYLTQNTNMGIWLVGEGGGFTSTAGISIGADYTLNNGDAQLLYQDTSKGSLFNNPTDLVLQVPGVGPGKLDLFLIADGDDPTSSPHNLYWTDLSVATPVSMANVNPDTLPHWLAFMHSSGDYLLYAAEDASDRNFTDTFLLIGARGIVVPEPETYLLLAAFLSVAVALRRRQAAKLNA